MTNTAKAQQAMEHSDVRFNEIPISQLFEKYESIGFTYPAKKRILEPYLEQIKHHWNQLISSKDDLLWIMTNSPEAESFASVSVIKQGNTGLMAQHLVSEGNPITSLKVMLAAQLRAQYHYDKSEVNSSQNWFRPDNRYAFRVFASMCKELGPQKSSLRRYEYLHFPFDQINTGQRSVFKVEEVKSKDYDFINFVRIQYGNVFMLAEELDSNDPELSQLGKAYKKCGMDYSRKVFKIVNQKTHEIVAAVVARRAPLGLNFSFLENRSYFIVDKNLSADQLKPIVQCMLDAVQPYYQGFPLKAIPITTDARTSVELQGQGAKYLRTYMQSIWLRSGFSQWFEHINSFLEKIDQRKSRRAR